MPATHPADQSVDPASLRTLAEDLARAAGTAALAGRRSLPVGQPPAHDTKSSATDPVTEFDRAAEAYIVDELRRLRPDDAIVGEEGAADSGTSGIEWHIDPIDGTANFLYDLPAWCTSVAAVRSDRPISDALAGAVYVPVTDEMFSAHVGGGATLNGITISASKAEAVSMSLIGTGFSYLEERRVAQADRIRSLLPQVRDIRRYGSAAIDLAFVACGRLDAYFEEHLNSWDMAAGLLIANEAGAEVSGFDGGIPDELSTVASAPGIHAALLAAIKLASN
jgi:myo-inositol-1(or 4)-monophosphatase